METAIRGKFKPFLREIVGSSLVLKGIKGECLPFKRCLLLLLISFDHFFPFLNILFCTVLYDFVL